MGYRMAMYKAWLRLSWVDENVMRRVVPRQFFYNAMITGVKHGWLDAATYAPAARRAWIAVAGYVDQNHDVTQVCEGTNKLNDLQYYLDRKRQTGNLHGQAPVMWAATALLRDEK